MKSLMGPKTSGRINFLVTMAISKSIQDGETIRLEVTCKMESVQRMKDAFESVIKRWPAEEHEGMWVGSIQTQKGNYRWSIELEFIAT